MAVFTSPISTVPGELRKTIPAYSEVNETIADLIVDSVSINSGYTSILKEVPGSNLRDQVNHHLTPPRCTTSTHL